MIVHGKKRKVDNCPNRLFLSYLKTWRNEAGGKESKSYHSYNKAYKTLEKYPLPLQNGKEAIILENFGSKICAMLDRQLNIEAKERGMTCGEYLEQSRSVPESWWDSVEKQNRQQKKNTKPSKSDCSLYVPQKNSGAYALLLTLYRCNSWLNKADLQTSAQPLAAKSFTVPDHGSRYTAWSSMATLISKDLVRKFSNPAKYEITDKGRELASKIESGESTSSVNVYGKKMFSKLKSNSVWDLSDSDVEIVDHSFSDALIHWNVDPETRFGKCTENTLDQVNSAGKERFQTKKLDLTLEPSNSQPIRSKMVLEPSVLKKTFNLGQVCLHPGSFRIVLCVDLRELSGDKRRCELRRFLEQCGIDYVERVLQVGDFMWIAQEKVPRDLGSQPRELVLDYVIERKCMSDLAQSIRDKRFREQKIRLKQCGVKRVIYLAEEMSQIDHQSLPGKTLRQALINTMIVDQMFVKYSEGLAETAQYLKSMTLKLQSTYENLTLRSSTLTAAKGRGTVFHSAVGCDLLTFDDFNHDCMKTKGLTANELFIKQLMQIRGMSFHKAHAIVQVYPTPLTLYEAYQNISALDEKENLLSKIKSGLSKRNIGISTSRNVYHVFNAN